METLSKLISRLKREGRFDAARMLHGRLVSRLVRQRQSRTYAERHAWQGIAREFEPIRPAITIPALKDFAPLYLPNRRRMEIAWAMLTALRIVGIRHAPHYEQSRQLLLALAATDVRRRLEKPCRPAATLPDLREGIASALLTDPLAALDEVTAILSILAEQCSRRRGETAEQTEREIAMILNELPILRIISSAAAGLFGKSLWAEIEQGNPNWQRGPILYAGKSETNGGQASLLP